MLKKIIEIKQQILEDENLIDFFEENNIRFIIRQVETRYCPCGKEFIKKGIGTINEKKFCSFGCKSRFTARLKYEFEKDNPEFKKKKKEYFEKWRKENREHFNDLLREPNRIKRKENYYKFDKLGLCVHCGRKRDNPNSKTCSKCYSIDKNGKQKTKKKS